MILDILKFINDPRTSNTTLKPCYEILILNGYPSDKLKTIEFTGDVQELYNFFYRRIGQCVYDQIKFFMRPLSPKYKNNSIVVETYNDIESLFNEMETSEKFLDKDFFINLPLSEEEESQIIRGIHLCQEAETYPLLAYLLSYDIIDDSLDINIFNTLVLQPNHNTNYTDQLVTEVGKILCDCMRKNAEES